MHNDGDTVEVFYKRVQLDETRRKFLDGLKEGRENSPVEEKSPVMKKDMSWDIQLVKNAKFGRIHHYAYSPINGAPISLDSANNFCSRTG